MKRTLLAVVAALAAVGAQAATISDQANLPLTLSTTEINVLSTLNKFDSSLGVLTGASLSITSGAEFTFSGTNTAAQAQNANITSSTTLLWSSDLAALSALLPQIGLSASSGIQAYTVGQSRAFGPLADSDTTTIDLSGILAALTGAGSFGVSCESLSGLTVLGGGGNIATTQQTVAGCGAEIVYTYEAAPPPPVPEPASLALVGLALAGVAAASRRRKA